MESLNALVVFTSDSSANGPGFTATVTYLHAWHERCFACAFPNVRSVHFFYPANGFGASVGMQRACIHARACNVRTHTDTQVYKRVYTFARSVCEHNTTTRPMGLPKEFAAHTHTPTSTGRLRTFLALLFLTRLRSVLGTGFARTQSRFRSQQRLSGGHVRACARACCHRHRTQRSTGTLQDHGWPWALCGLDALRMDLKW